MMQPIDAQTISRSYTISTEDFANPERGFYRYSETRSGNYSLLNVNELAGYRSLHQPNGTSGFEIYSTLVFRYFFLEDFINDSISQDYLDNMQLDFDRARAAGVKLIPRFAYTDAVSAGSCGLICPPYGDASKATILMHIAQVGPLLKKNRDVIAAIQMGWIGIWGEQYYTDFFGDASQGPNFQLGDQNWVDRIEVLNAFLEATPTDRMIQARYVQQKQKSIYGVNATTSSAAMTLSEAYQGDHKSRIGFHNDCYLASDDDFGTYTDYGTSSTSSISDTTNLKPYKAADTQYVVVGGETCAANNPDDNCAPLGRADSEMRRMHYSYLNANFNYPDVISDWEGDCIENIKKDLGYRLHLKSAEVSSSAQPGGTIEVTLEIENVGYAAPYNPRNVELVLRQITSGQKLYVNLDADPRLWFSGESITINQSVCTPDDMPIGPYNVLLNLPDPASTLIDNPNYAIRLASELNATTLWESSTGYNDLGISLSMIGGGTNSNCVANSMLGYCHESISISLVDQVNFEANRIITSEATHDNTTTLSAGQQIDLLPDFNVSPGVSMEAQIERCEDN